MYAVVHGGIDKDLRKLSCATLSKLDFEGFAIGGSLGKNHQEMFELLEFTMPLVPQEKPNHLLGIGDLHSLKNCIQFGVDTFDSSHPTKCARHGLIFTKNGNLKIQRSSFKEDFVPIDKDCRCTTCQTFTRAYLHHLFKAKEPVAHTLATIHNLQFMIDLMANYRQQILDGTL